MSLKFPQALKELRIHFGANSPGSAAVKTFVEKNYASLKKANPHTPILIREALGVKPVAFARFDYGKEVQTALDTGDVSESIKELVQRSD